MARSEYIYVLQNHFDGTIMAARTVKRELIDYIHRCGWSRSLLEKNCQVLRFSDNGFRAPYIYDWLEIPKKVQ